MWAGECLWVIPTVILPRRIKRWVRVKRVDTEQPGLIFPTIFFNKLDSFFGAPIGLVEMRRDVVKVLRGFWYASPPIWILLRDCFPCYQRCGINTLQALPICVLVSDCVGFTVIVAVLEVAITVIHALFLRIEGTCKMEFTNQSTIVTVLREGMRNQSVFVILRKNRISVTSDAHG